MALAKQDFHIGVPTWTPPGAQEGGGVERYLGADAVAEKLTGGKHVVVGSTVPLRVNDGSGLAPVSLSLHGDGEAYVPANPLVPIAISTVASRGISFADGLSVAPVSAAGAEPPVLVGNRVVFANAARDTDLMAEPAPSGAAMSWQLRSQESPQEEALAFHLPPGGVLRSSKSMPGAVEVLVEGKRQLLVPPANAVSANGSLVPVSYSVSGDVLTTHVDLSGSVDFPVLVDPEVYVLYGYYGNINGSGTWAGWHDVLTSNFEFYDEPDILEVTSPHGAPYNSYAQLYIDAPGEQGHPGSAGITRVDLTGFSHSSEESEGQGEIGGDNGTLPVYSFNGSIAEDTRAAPLSTHASFDAAIAFCAQEGGGINEALCDEENNQGTYFDVAAVNAVQPATASYNHVSIASARVTYRESAPPNKVLLLHPGYEGQWLQVAPNNFQIEAESEGLGIREWALEVPAGNPNGAYAKESIPCATQNGFIGCPSFLVTEAINLAGVTETGVNELAPSAVGAAGYIGRPLASVVKLYLDKTKPVIGAFTGTLGKAEGGVINDLNYTLGFSAEDGVIDHPQSGGHTLEVKVDGKLVDTVTTTCPLPHGIPNSNCFRLSGEWTMNGETYGAGAHTVTVVAKDWAGNESTKSFKVTVNEPPPVLNEFGGALAHAANGLIGNGNYALAFAAEDGSPAAPKLGVRTLEVRVDGNTVDTVQSACSEPHGVPAEGCFGLSGEWTMTGQTFGAGTHTVTVVAKDWAGDESSKSLLVTVNEAAYQPLGPGAVNLQTGDYKITANDVSVAAGGATLSVTRTYDSRGIQGVTGPFGSQWAMSLPASGAEEQWQSLGLLSDGSVALTAAHGGMVTFAPKESGGYTAPARWQGDTLTKVTAAEYRLSDSAGDYTAFTQPVSGAAFVPTTVVQASAAGGLNPVKYTFAESSEGFLEPTEVVGGEPSPGAGCTPTLTKGCRALTFEYATSTSASGEGPTEWSEYKGRLARVKFSAWSTSEGKMAAPIPIAEYAYDTQGQLRAEWDPQITPALKTVYGYNSEKLVSAVTPPGQEAWALTYGATAGDPSTGRLLKVFRPPAATTLWKGKQPGTTEVPVVSGTPVVGNRMAVSNGGWSGEPLAYSYQWERCPPGGGSCSPILGATNANYTPVVADENYYLLAHVSAVNGGGSTTVSSARTSTAVQASSSESKEGELHVSQPGWTIDYGVLVSGTGAPHALGSKEVEAWAQRDDPSTATAIFPPDEPQSWPAGDYTRAEIFYLDSTDNTVNVAFPSGAISTAEYNSYDNLTRTLTPDNREAALKARNTSEAAQLLSTDRIYTPEGVELQQVLGPEHEAKLPNGTEGPARKSTRYFYDEGDPTEGRPYRLVTKTTEGAQDKPGGGEEVIRTITTGYSGQENLGWNLHEPTSSSTSDGTTTLKTITTYEPKTGNVEESRTPAAAGKDAKVPPGYGTAFGSKGAGSGQFESLSGTAIDAGKNVWAVDPGDNRIEKFSAAGVFVEALGFGVSNGEEKLQTCTSTCRAGIAGAHEGQFSDPVAIAVANGDIYIADNKNDRIEKYNEAGEYLTEFGTKGSIQGEFEGPMSVAVSSSENVWVGDSTNNRLEEFTTAGKFIATIGYGVSSGESKFQICEAKGVSCRAGIAGAGIGQFNGVRGIAFAQGNMYVADYGNDRIDKFNEKGESPSAFGEKGAANGQFNGPTGIATNPTNGYLYITDTGNDRIQAFSTGGEYVYQFAWKGTTTGQLLEPEGIAINSSGDAYVADTGNYRLQEWAPAISGNEGAHTTQTIYYTAGANTRVAACGGHAEWAGLPCQAQPAAQPETPNLPNLPVTTYTYNIWDEPLTTTDTVGSTTRTTTLTYDPAGRPLTSTITSNSTADLALPAVSDEYNTETGALTKQSTTSEGKTQAITTTQNALGQPTTYTDADGNVTKYEYEHEKDYRLLKVNDGEGTAAASTASDTYNATTGELAGVTDSTAGTFSVTRDIEGNVTSESYPNGMSADYTRNQAGERTALEYVKTTDCTSKCVWYTDTVTPSIGSLWTSQTSTFSKENYSYTEDEQLSEVQEALTGGDCTARLYSYDEDGNRTSLTTRESASEKCGTEGGTSQNNSYDSADRLNEAGVTYDPFGNTASLPAADAGGSPLTSTFYVNGALASQEQGGVKISYNRDPAERVSETVTGTNRLVEHYAGLGEGVAWTCEGTTPVGKCEGKANWTRNIRGVGGQLAAIETNGKEPVLQLADLHGDIIGTAILNEKKSKLVPANEATEYGVPRTTITAKYSWLGAQQKPTELPTGIINMGARAYIPQLGRFEQADPQPGGSINAYAYTFDDPVNEADLSGEAATYNYEAAEAGEAEAGLPEAYGAPGAIKPPPANQQAESEFAAHPPWDAVRASRVIWEKPGCSGTSACAAGSILGFKVEFGEIFQWWKQAKKGYELVKETYVEPLFASIKENETVCKAVGYGISAGGYFVPGGKLSKILTVAVGFGATWAC